MTILAIDTTGFVMHIALFYNGKFFSVEKSMELKKCESIICLIKSLLKKAKLNIEQIDYLGVSTGPGSFTGIRIGISTMKALAYSLKKPLIGYKSIDLNAWIVKDDFRGLLCIMQDARRSQLYSAIYGNGHIFRRLTPYLLCDISQLMEKIKRLSQADRHRIKKYDKKFSNLYFYGDIVSNYKEQIKKVFPHSIILASRNGCEKTQAMISLTKKSIRPSRSSFELLPFYMYAKDCQVRRSDGNPA